MLRCREQEARRAMKEERRMLFARLLRDFRASLGRFGVVPSVEIRIRSEDSTRDGHFKNNKISRQCYHFDVSRKNDLLTS